MALKYGEKYPELLRVVIFNPNLILGPMFHDPEMNESLEVFKAILKGDAEKELDSLSFIDVRDLAELELAALENKNARGQCINKLLWKWLVKSNRLSSDDLIVLKLNWLEIFEIHEWMTANQK